MMMATWRALHVWALVVMLLIGASCVAPVSAVEPIRPIPTSVDVDAEKVALGRMLFFEVKLSKTDSVSCNTCHDLEQGGSDGRRVSIGVDGTEGFVNAPTVYDSAGSIRQF